MSKKTTIAHSIIDLIENAIRKNHPEIEKLASKCEGNTLLHGEVYYNLENDVIDEIENDFGYCDNCDGRRYA